MSTKISELKKDDVKGVNDLILLASNITRGSFKQKDGFYFKFDFQDISGTISGNMWEVPEDLVYLEEKCQKEKGVYVGVACNVSAYQDKLQLNITKIKEVDESLIDPRNFLPVCVRDENALMLKAKSFIQQVEDVEYKNLLMATFSDPEILNGFKKGIGGIKVHHNYVGGLLEHTIQVVSTALFAAKDEFMFPELNKDLIIVGGFFHDLGKINEYLFTKSFSMNDDEVEHRYGGVSLLDMIIYKNNVKISKDKVKKIKNIIMSHHGEFGDKNIRFETPEAIAVHAGDIMSSQINSNLKNSGLLNIPFSEQK